jgi:hypothetical protein
VLAVDGAVVGALASIPIVGWAVAPFAVFYRNVAAVALYGQGYRDATRRDGPETADGERRTAASVRRHRSPDCSLVPASDSE